MLHFGTMANRCPCPTYKPHASARILAGIVPRSGPAGPVAASHTGNGLQSGARMVPGTQGQAQSRVTAMGYDGI